MTDLVPSAPPPSPMSAIATGVPRTGEEDFQEQLVGMIEPAYRLALRLTGEPQDAEDLVQEAALRAHRFREGFQPGTSFKAWFYRILVNQFYTSVRRRRNTAHLDALSDAHEIYLYLRSAEAGLLPSGGDPVETTVSRMAADDVASALAALPDEFRTVCTLYFMDDLSYQEIADVLRLPVGTVRSRLHRGRRMLQKRLWQVAQELGIVPTTTSDLERASGEAR